MVVIFVLNVKHKQGDAEGGRLCVLNLECSALQESWAHLCVILGSK